MSNKDELLIRILDCGHAEVAMLDEMDSELIEEAMDVIIAQDISLTFDSILNEIIVEAVTTTLDKHYMDELEPYFDVYVNGIATSIDINASDFLEDNRDLKNFTEQDEWMDIENINTIRDDIEELTGVGVDVQ